MSQVTYNGRIGSYASCSGDPKQLELGRKYEIASVKQGRFFTLYELKGLHGTFNSCWFNEKVADLFPQTFLAVSNDIPVVGQGLKCDTIMFANGRPVYDKRLTSTIVESVQIGLRTFQVKTQNSIYYVEVRHF